MNFQMIWRHKGLLTFTLVMMISAFIVSISVGHAIPFQMIEWSDVIGESCIALFTIAWIFAALISRPPGSVTRLMTIGLSCFMFSALLDMMDEFVDYPSYADWVSMLEPLPAALGMIVMSIALFGWHKEQVALNKQLNRREMLYRSHKKIDVITQLYTASYWLERALGCQESNDINSVIALDINDFSTANRRYGVEECDRYLREIANLILMNIREYDLACRYAGDRFIILLPNTHIDAAQQLARHMAASISHVAFQSEGLASKNRSMVSSRDAATVFHTVRTACETLSKTQSIESLLQTLNACLDGNRKPSADSALEHSASQECASKPPASGQAA